MRNNITFMMTIFIALTSATHLPDVLFQIFPFVGNCGFHVMNFQHAGSLSLSLPYASYFVSVNDTFSSFPCHMESRIFDENY